MSKKRKLEKPEKPKRVWGDIRCEQLKNYARQKRFQREFKLNAGRRVADMPLMREHRKKVEQCNRLQAIVKLCNQYALRGVVSVSILVLSNEFNHYKFLPLSMQADLSSIGLIKEMDAPIVLGEVIRMERMINARKGALVKTDKQYRTISTSYFRWCAMRDSFGAGCKKNELSDGSS